MRAAIEVPGRTAALVTPDRNLAQRVSALLERWNISADDSAGRPLSATPPGTLLLALATAAVEGFAPAPLLALFKHPLVKKGDARLGWLDQVRALDLALRGPRPCAGLAGITTYLSQGDARAAKLRKPAQEGWAEASALIAPLERGFAAPAPRLADLVSTLRETMTVLGGERVWSGGDGRMLADLIAEVEALAGHGPQEIAPHALPALLRQLLDEKSVRPPQGGHPRLFIWGLIEAQLQSADLMILGGLNEGVWPALPAPDPWLAPAIRKQLSLPSLERRIGLAAHDLVGALGSPAALLTRARRDASAPTIASRFWLRLETMTGGLPPPLLRADSLAKALDHDASGPHRAACPAPAPPTGDRPRKISVTDVDKLKADPFAFYAKAMLKVLPLDAVDADPGPAWRGNLIHDVLHDWARHDDYAPDRLTQRMEAAFNDGTLHPLIRALWLPRLLDAVQWIEAKVADGRAEGRVPVLAEETGAIEYAGVKLHGRADRVDSLADGTLSIVDYKSGSPPSDKATKEGFAMQLGLIGLIAERGGFNTLSGTTTGFEYWSLAKKNDAFGWVRSPTAGKGANKSDPETFVAVTAAQFADAAGKWLTGTEPFTAKLHPDYARDDYDHLMRLEEWQGRRG
jgi:ATP-dependent helicase/nuclease subunit B